jgi:hypothetical protein
VPGLDGVNRERRRKDLLALDVARLAEVGRGAEVLDGRRRLSIASVAPLNRLLLATSS